MQEKDLERLVDRFYAKVRDDQMIGPLFNSAVADWPEHLEKLTAFWSSVMLTSGRYKGNPMAAHVRHGSNIEPQMFDRWLALWSETATELLDGPAAARVLDRRRAVLPRRGAARHGLLPPSWPRPSASQRASSSASTSNFHRNAAPPQPEGDA